MKLTLAGDADVDGVVDFNDLVKVAQNYDGEEFSAFWDDGDFNYDHRVEFADLVPLAQNYNGTFAPTATGAIRGAPSDFADDFARAFASVPEPSSADVVAAFGMATATRRRHRQARPTTPQPLSRD